MKKIIISMGYAVSERPKPLQTNASPGAIEKKCGRQFALALQQAVTKQGKQSPTLKAPKPDLAEEEHAALQHKILVHGGLKGRAALFDIVSPALIASGNPEDKTNIGATRRFHLSDPTIPAVLDVEMHPEYLHIRDY
ncbi:hypothetical protein N431DRAFT_452310 [Stipitochalara longipes BDJ]|nr:hypothetical protein N431DRAFT_452310 [Stipitochalara longipes BDJ]